MSRRVTVDIALPIYNESACLEWSVRSLRSYLDDRFPWRSVITIVDNASTDDSWEIASGLALDLPGVRALHLDAKGRGRALRAAWAASDADVVAYMDVDLSTGLDGLLPLIAPLVSGHADVAIGSRLAHGARVFRGPKRESISRLYNLILRVALGCRFSDAQCGFKAMRADDARTVLPMVADNEWFFDTELLVVAERAGLRVHEVPVDWADDPDSSVDIADTAIKDLQGVWRMLRSCPGVAAEAPTIRPAHLPPSLAELLTTASLGAGGMVAYWGLFILFGPLLGVYLANLTALALGVGFSAAVRARRRGHGPSAGGSWPGVAGSAVVMATSVVATTAVIGLAALMGAGSTAAGLAAATVGMSAAAATRFLLLRHLVFHSYLDRVPRRADGVGNGAAGPASGRLVPHDIGNGVGVGVAERVGTPTSTPPVLGPRPNRVDADTLAHS